MAKHFTSKSMIPVVIHCMAAMMVMHMGCKIRDDNRQLRQDVSDQAQSLRVLAVEVLNRPKTPQSSPILPQPVVAGHIEVPRR